MRAIIPVADTAPMEDGPEGVDDPVPVVEAPRPEPEIAPPQMLPPAVDPALERAMMGEVSPQPPERAPGIPHWVKSVPPRWLVRAAGVAGIVAITTIVMLLSRKPNRVAPAKPAPAAAAITPTPTPTPDSNSDSTPAPSAPAPNSGPPAVSPYAKQFQLAQKALSSKQVPKAELILQDLLRKQLSRPDLARASKMMGDAEKKKGNKAVALGRYRKALPLTDDREERARIVKLLH